MTPDPPGRAGQSRPNTRRPMANTKAASRPLGPSDGHELGSHAGNVSLRGEFVPVGGDGLAQRFGVRFGLLAFDAGRFEVAGDAKGVEG